MSADKARLAKDMVDPPQLNEKEGERKALEQVALAEFLASRGEAPLAASLTASAGTERIVREPP